MSDSDTDSDNSATRPFVARPKRPTRAHKSKPQIVRRQNKFKRKRRALCIAMGCAAIILALVVLCLTIFTSEEENDYRAGNATRSNISVWPTYKVQRQRKNVLLWQWNNPTLWQNGDFQFIDGNWLSPEELRNHITFDAVIFNASADYKAHPLPMPRLPQQYYIYALDRPLTRTFQERHNASELAQFFNLTLSYKLDSDIPWVTYTVRNMNGTKIYAPSSQRPVWLEPVTALENDWRIAFSMRYNTSSLLTLTVIDAPCDRIRDELVTTIAKNISLHIYGNCRRMPLPNKCSTLPLHYGRDSYKFYFVFEEELCTDYVPPCFYQALKDGIVPVVFGGADYTRFAPPQSYIQAENFKSIHELLEYLYYLHENMDEYLKYLLWRKQYTIQQDTNPYRAVYEYLRRDAPPIARNNFKAWLANNECHNNTKLSLTVR